MNEQLITYEQAINEQTRVCLKTEQFLKRVDEMLKIDSPWAAETLARAIIDITILFDRTDIKAKISKQLRELSEELQKHLLSPHCDKPQTEELIRYLMQYQQFLLNIDGKFLEPLRNDRLLKTIKHCLQQPSGACSHEAPSMHRWIYQAYPERQPAIQGWLQQLYTIRSIITVILHILRESATVAAKTASAGQYSQNIKSTKDCQLVRITLPRDSLFYPEISAGKQHLNVRFIDSRNSLPSEEDLSFELSLCY